MYKIFEEGRKVSLEGPMAKFHLGKFGHLAKGNFTLIEARINFKGLEKIRNANPQEKIVYFDVEEPNRFCSGDKAFRREEWEPFFYHIFNICPFTAKWLNGKPGFAKRTSVFYPFDEACIPAKSEKKYDVIYVGNIFSKELSNLARTISKFNYRLIADYCFSAEVTDRNVTHTEKLRLISESKIAIVHNMLSFHGSQITNTQKTADFRSNEAFRFIPDPNILSPLWNKISGKEYLVPQLKTRAFESAFSRSIILCRKDPFNVIEQFFEPGKEFIYYEPDKLEETINEVLVNYDSYLPIIENAFKRATSEYTSQKFFEKYLKELK